MRIARKCVIKPLVILTITACGGPLPSVKLTRECSAEPSEDYEAVTQKWTRSATLQREFQQVVKVSVTFKSPEWRTAMALRNAQYRNLATDKRRHDVAQACADSEGPLEFEVLVTTWDRRENDLDRGDRSIWRLVLVDDAGNEHRPLDIVKDKRSPGAIRADFPALEDFAIAYVVRFQDAPEAPLLGANVRGLRLGMSSPRGSVQVSWSATP